MIVARTVPLADSLARANVLAALTGPGAPAGVIETSDEGAGLSIRFDDAVVSAELIDDLVAIESVFVPAKTARALSQDDAATIAAAGLGDPEIDASRIIESYL